MIERLDVWKTGGRRARVLVGWFADGVDGNDEYDVCACDARENETQMVFAKKKLNEYYCAVQTPNFS